METILYHTYLNDYSTLQMFFLRLFTSNIKLATDEIVSLLSLFISVFNLSLSDRPTVSQRSKLLLSNKVYSGILVKYLMLSSVY